MAERKIEYRIVAAPLFHLFRVVILNGKEETPSFLGDFPSQEKAEAERDQYSLQDQVLDD